ncbi:hypothetical protein BD779DRAFT_346022 [Infundibulicybe gibba]|nr:hypothetical protein BD779DRAFT_346022 [Infundibulicybe gibba]
MHILGIPPHNIQSLKAKPPTHQRVSSPLPSNAYSTLAVAAGAPATTMLSSSCDTPDTTNLSPVRYSPMRIALNFIQPYWLHHRLARAANDDHIWPRKFKPAHTIFRCPITDLSTIAVCYI